MATCISPGALLPRPSGGRTLRADAASDTTPPTVLLAEDDPGVRRAMLRILEGRGYRVIEAADGPCALEADALNGPPDLLLADIVMPGMSGVRLAALLAERHPCLPVVFMSGYAPDPELQARLARPGTAFLAKPFGSAELVAALSQALGEPRT